VVAQIASPEILHHQVEVVAVLEALMGVYDEGVVEFGEELFFVEDAGNTFLGDDSAWG
jgi:hypothetical protein